jgi:hypothetical protein
VTWRRFWTVLGLVAVTSVAGAISYEHQSSLALHHGQQYWLAKSWPACVDGLVLVTGLAIADDRSQGMRARLWALSGFWLGVVISVVTNSAATSGGILNHGISAFPAVAFLIAVESLSSKPRPPKTVNVPVVVPAQQAKPTRELTAEKPQVEPVSAPPASKYQAPKPTVSRSTLPLVQEALKRKPDGSPAQIAALAGVSESSALRHLRTLRSPVTAAAS